MLTWFVKICPGMIIGLVWLVQINIDCWLGHHLSIAIAAMVRTEATMLRCVMKLLRRQKRIPKIQFLWKRSSPWYHQAANIDGRKLHPRNIFHTFFSGSFLERWKYAKMAWGCSKMAQSCKILGNFGKNKQLQRPCSCFLFWISVLVL